MNLLLDTHAFIWFVQNNPHLSRTAVSWITDPANRKLVSIATCWEMAIKASLGKLKLGERADSFLARELETNNFELLPVDLVHATAVETLPLHHRDPFDRMLIAQAIAEAMPVVGADTAFDLYPVRRIW